MYAVYRMETMNDTNNLNNKTRQLNGATFTFNKMDILRLAVGDPLSTISAALSAAQEAVKSSENQDDKQFEKIVSRQTALIEFQAQLARVAQEVSIAQRIALSDEVEIEEFYDTSGKGNVGVKSDASNLSLGASGEGRKVTKRIIKFSGWNPIVNTENGEEK